MKGDLEPAVSNALERNRLAAGSHVPDADHVILDAGRQNIAPARVPREMEDVRPDF